jgi:hypothetical protein
MVRCVILLGFPCDVLQYACLMASLVFVLSCVAFSSIVLCCVVLCCVFFYCVVLCCVVLCCVVLRCVVSPLFVVSHNRSFFVLIHIVQSEDTNY